MEQAVLLKNRKPDRITTLAEYQASGGYEALRRILSENSRQALLDMIDAADLLGRGGAAFPMGRKLATVAEDAPHPRYLVCNADEMEPGTFKDRVLIHADPHQLIEGMVLAAYSIQASHGIIFIRPEYEGAARILEREIGLAQAAGLVGENILGSGYTFHIEVHRSGGRYICGEATAQLNALEGRRPNPRKPPPYPTQKGLWGLPTLTQNVETLCCLPHIVNHGAKWFKSLALTDEGSGTKVFQVSGKVQKPGCYELPMGTPLSRIIEDHAGGMLPGSRFKACLPGGASTRFMPRDLYDIQMDVAALRQAGYRLGTAAIMIFDHKTCMVGVTLNLIQFFARESCGWCTPCREGLPYILHILERIESGQGRDEHIGMLEAMAGHLWKAYCAFAPGAASPVESLLTHFADEVKAHITEKTCPFKKGKVA